MSGVLSFSKYIQSGENVFDIQDHFPNSQSNVGYNFSNSANAPSNLNTWTAHISWQTLIVDNIVRDVNNNPNLNLSKVLGSFSGGDMSAPAGQLLLLPLNMYTGPILPAAQVNVPITVVDFQFTNGAEIFNQELLLIENWAPGITPGNPILDPNFIPVVSTPSNLVLTTNQQNILIGDRFTLSAASDIPIALLPTSQAKFYLSTGTLYPTLLGTGTFVNHVSTLTVNTNTLGVGNWTFYATFSGIRQYGFVKSNTLTEHVVTGYPLSVNILATPNPVNTGSDVVIDVTAQIANGYPSTSSHYITNALQLAINDIPPYTGEVLHPYASSGNFVNAEYITTPHITNDYAPTSITTSSVYYITHGAITDRTFNYSAQVNKDYEIDVNWDSLHSQTILAGSTSTRLTVTSKSNYSAPTTPITVSMVQHGTNINITNAFINETFDLRADVNLVNINPINTTATDVAFYAQYSPQLDIQRYFLQETPSTSTQSSGTVYMPIILAANQAIMTNYSSNLIGATFNPPYDNFNNIVYDPGTYTIVSATNLGNGTGLATLDHNWQVSPYSAKFQQGGNSISFPLVASVPAWFNTFFLPGDLYFRAKVTSVVFDFPVQLPYRAIITQESAGVNSFVGSDFGPHSPGYDSGYVNYGQDVYSPSNQILAKNTATLAYMNCHVTINYGPRDYDFTIPYHPNDYMRTGYYQPPGYQFNDDGSLNSNYYSTLYFTRLDSAVAVGSTFSIGNTKYSVAGVFDYYYYYGNLKGVITDPPWYKHNPEILGNNNLNIQFSNISYSLIENTPFVGCAITSLAHPPSNQVGASLYTFDQITFAGTQPLVGSTFRLYGNTHSPEGSFVLTSKNVNSGVYTFEPPYTIDNASGPAWQQNDQTYNYFMANEANTNEANRYVTFNQPVINTQVGQVVTGGTNFIQVNYIPVGFYIPGGYVVADGISYTITAVDLLNKILTFVGDGIGLIGKNVTFYNAPITNYTTKFLGTATQFTQNGSAYRWTLPNFSLTTGTYLITATMTTHVIDGFNAPTNYPGNPIVANHVQSATGINPLFNYSYTFVNTVTSVLSTQSFTKVLLSNLNTANNTVTKTNSRYITYSTTQISQTSSGTSYSTSSYDVITFISTVSNYSPLTTITTTSQTVQTSETYTTYDYGYYSTERKIYDQNGTYYYIKTVTSNDLGVSTSSSVTENVSNRVLLQDNIFPSYINSQGYEPAPGITSVNVLSQTISTATSSRVNTPAITGQLITPVGISQTTSTLVSQQALVTVTSNMATSIDPAHFYVFEHPVKFYLDGGFIAQANWSRQGTTLIQSATGIVNANAVNSSTFVGSWEGSLDYVRQYSDQVLFSPASFNLDIHAPTTLTLNLTTTTVNGPLAIAASIQHNNSYVVYTTPTGTIDLTVQMLDINGNTLLSISTSSNVTGYVNTLNVDTTTWPAYYSSRNYYKLSATYGGDSHNQSTSTGYYYLTVYPADSQFTNLGYTKYYLNNPITTTMATNVGQNDWSTVGVKVDFEIYSPYVNVSSNDLKLKFLATQQSSVNTTLWSKNSTNQITIGAATSSTNTWGTGGNTVNDLNPHGGLFLTNFDQSNQHGYYSIYYYDAPYPTYLESIPTGGWTGISVNLVTSSTISVPTNTPIYLKVTNITQLTKTLPTTIPTPVEPGTYMLGPLFLSGKVPSNYPVNRMEFWYGIADTGGNPVGGPVLLMATQDAPANTNFGAGQIVNSNYDPFHLYPSHPEVRFNTPGGLGPMPPGWLGSAFKMCLYVRAVNTRTGVYSSYSPAHGQVWYGYWS